MQQSTDEKLGQSLLRRTALLATLVRLASADVVGTTQDLDLNAVAGSETLFALGAQSGCLRSRIRALLDVSICIGGRRGHFRWQPG